MKKPLKYGLIAGGIALTVITALMVSGYNSAKSMPSRPTPAGVIMPPGLRYIGGDEFDGADGTKPSTLKVGKWDTATPEPEFEIRGGILHFSPTCTGTSPSSAVGFSYLTPIDMRIPGRLEVRIRVRLSERTKTYALARKSKTSPRHEEVFGGILYPLKDDYGFRIFSYEFGNTPTGIDEADAHPPQSNTPEEYCTYALQWRQGEIIAYRNGIQNPGNDDGNEAILPYWLLSSSLLPKRLTYHLAKWTEWAPNRTPYSIEISFGDFSPGGDPSQRDVMEIDYIRIFQE